MNSYSFTAFGHKNITATHPTTLQFTKESDITPKADCIIGVSASFDCEKLSPFLKSRSIKITITIDTFKDTILAHPNPSFSDEHELVIRKSPFPSARTFATNATKTASKINKKIIEKLKDPQTKIIVTLYEK